MFSVYGVTGRVFKGAMEELRQVTAVGAVARTRGIEPLSPQVMPATTAGSAAAQAAASAGRRSPLAAYAQAGAAQTQRHPLSKVADVMSRGVTSVPADMPVLDAWQLLAAQGLGQAPVVDGHGWLVGLLTRADLLQPDKLPLPGANSLVWRAMLSQPVADIMWTPVPAVGPDTDLRRVARVLLDTHLPGLPVVNDDGTVIGFVSRTDILRAVVNDPPLDLWS